MSTAWSQVWLQPFVRCSKLRGVVYLLISLIVLLEIHQFFFLVPSNYTLLSEMRDLNHLKLSLYQIHGRDKFFVEADDNRHLDRRYVRAGSAPLSRNETVDTLYFLLERFLAFVAAANLSTSYASREPIPSAYAHFGIRDGDPLLLFLDYGTLLGAYRNQSIIPWDLNADLGCMFHDLRQLPARHEAPHWLFTQNEYVMAHSRAMHIHDGHNTIAARVISKRNGVFINVMAYSFIRADDDDDDDAGATYVYSTIDFLDNDKWHKAVDLFPLQKEGGLLRPRLPPPPPSASDTGDEEGDGDGDGNGDGEGDGDGQQPRHRSAAIKCAIPRDTKKWLLTYYDNLDIPFEYDERYMMSNTNMYDGHYNYMHDDEDNAYQYSEYYYGRGWRWAGGGRRRRRHSRRNNRSNGSDGGDAQHEKDLRSLKVELSKQSAEIEKLKQLILAQQAQPPPLLKQSAMHAAAVDPAGVNQQNENENENKNENKNDNENENRVLQSSPAFLRTAQLPQPPQQRNTGEGSVVHEPQAPRAQA